MYICFEHLPQIPPLKKTVICHLSSTPLKSIINSASTLPHPPARKTSPIIWNFQKFFIYLHRELTTYNMTAIDLRASTMQILERFDKTDTSLWQKVLDAINSIYKDEEEAQQAKKAQQKAKIRQMVGILKEESAGDWKREKEEALVEKYQ